LLSGCKTGQPTTIIAPGNSLDVRQQYAAYAGDYLIVEDIGVSDHHLESVLLGTSAQPYAFFSGRKVTLPPAEYACVAQCVLCYKPRDTTAAISLQKPCFLIAVRQPDQLTTVLVSSSGEVRAFFEHLSACPLPTPAQHALAPYQAYGQAKP
jgi:hypothetical protein